MKAIVLCAGLGTRLRPLTFTTAKHLIPVANKPVLYYGIEYLRNVGIREIGVIVSKDSYPPISAALENGARWGVQITYIEQPEPKGLAHAAACARGFLGEEPFLMFLGDTLVPEGLGGLVRSFERGVDAVVMLKAVDDPSAFGIAVVEGDRIVRLVEKPKDPPSNLAIVGAYLFTPEIFPSIERIRPSWRNEYEITDAIQDLVDRGRTARAYVVRGWWKDTGKPEDILEANRVLLETIEARVAGTIDPDSSVIGKVAVGVGTVVTRSTLIGPLVIGADARIDGSVVGPHVAAGDRVRLLGCTIRNSVILEDASILNPQRPLEGCLIGRNARIWGAASAVQLVLADQSAVAI